MFSVWEVSTDSIVKTLIVVCISALAIAWLFAGRRRPAKEGSLEQRRLAGREAEIFAAQTAPPVKALGPEPDSEEVVIGTEAVAAQVEAPLPAPAVSFEHPRQASADTLPAEEAPLAVTQSTPPEHSPEKASAISIAAALVRHDKREAAPPNPSSKEVSLNCDSTGGDDLTAISGIDRKLAKELNDLGIRYFDQIVTMSPDHAAWIASRLSSSITVAQRRAWIEEAKALAEHETLAIRKQAERAG